MKEKEYLQIEFINQPINKRDFCHVPSDEGTSQTLTKLLVLEQNILQGFATRKQWDQAVVSHMRLWNKLSDYYKSELADLTAIYKS